MRSQRRRRTAPGRRTRSGRRPAARPARRARARDPASTSSSPAVRHLTRAISGAASQRDRLVVLGGHGAAAGTQQDRPARLGLARSSRRRRRPGRDRRFSTARRTGSSDFSVRIAPCADVAAPARRRRRSSRSRIATPCGGIAPYWRMPPSSLADRRAERDLAVDGVEHEVPVVGLAVGEVLDLGPLDPAVVGASPRATGAPAPAGRAACDAEPWPATPSDSPSVSFCDDVGVDASIVPPTVRRPRAVGSTGDALYAGWSSGTSMTRARSQPARVAVDHRGRVLLAAGAR